ncbi:hypothetical protein COW36_06660 [bacterium (Candidatus Blackallbacteria) CG17_big_fil_post_rev_8_21_14_2_50_48_46]|uniref:Uncharacterized protein n=1 Tax=bacterium (Candidatus Blackallbacteria) CG17_big_fil_post_rev_8_21_14_2_50_48_46 TaxID=2014261 RepID=A0A2M7G7F8_9BACT|nr:MAG: hypothetical protein COW64_15240 [bacterium (Candidatus Blackallbacteria) CG18_big_fil_WC_8_21_14_2_50_49_26]PIW18019.1 MAG: hypothetical protein COW36_06660 [bacterium (Candidatus Blackallbacteria) CG17_big_fil_post_rev_8_21_14_2_50_48_46]PIW50938.1 MAG: hypothetical protein COW20_00855 [bacterium (Candidatus Blackallbacteria) CG13_big_fil_rev_8_21_14_2_50_49_14]
MQGAASFGRVNSIVPTTAHEIRSKGKEDIAFRSVSRTEMRTLENNAQTTSTSLKRTGWKLSTETTSTPKALGSKEQIDLLKAKIDSVKYSSEENHQENNPLSKPAPSTLSTISAYGKWIGKGMIRTLETITVIPLAFDKGARKDLKDLMNLAKESMSQTLHNSDAYVGSDYIRTGQTLLQQADHLEESVAHSKPKEEFNMRLDLAAAKQMHETLTAKLNPTPEDTREINRLDEKIQFLDSHLGKVDSLRQKATQLRLEGQNAIALGMKVRGDKSELATKYIGYPALVTGSLAKTTFTAVQAGTGLAKGSGVEVSLKVGAGALGVSTQALQVTGIVGAGVSIVIDSYDFYKTSKLHNKELNKVEMAEALLTDHAGRLDMAAKLDQEASRLEQTGFKGSMARLGAKLNPFASRSNPKELRDKAIAIRSLSPDLSPETLNPAVKAVVTQIKEHADLGKKRLSMIKNVVGIVGAGLAIAALAVACPPAGLVVAACVIGVAAGGAGLLMSYNNWKTSSQRFENVTDLRKGLEQIDLKQKHIQTELTQLSKLPEAQNPESETGKKIEMLSSQARSLNELKISTTLNLLAASPDDAAQEIFKQAKAGDPAMHYIARTVLDVPYENLPPKVAIDALARGMHLDVNK